MWLWQNIWSCNSLSALSLDQDKSHFGEMPQWHLMPFEYNDLPPVADISKIFSAPNFPDLNRELHGQTFDAV